MSEKKPAYANFPERGLKVLIGPHINATNTKLLRKLTIGTYEMSVNQQEKIGASVENARMALTDLARDRKLIFETVEHRECAGVFRAGNDECRFQVWISTPFESGQTTHLVWTQYTDPREPRRIGLIFKLSTSYSTDDFVAMCKKAQDAAVDLEPDAPVVIQGNPPPRFKKKAVADAEKAAAEAEKVPEAGADAAPEPAPEAKPIVETPEASDPPGGD
jgi:hypothetical protein